MSGAGSRRKGNAGELELLRLWNHAGLHGRKVSRLGYSETDLMLCFRHTNSLLCVRDHRCEESVEVKRRKGAFVQIDRWLEDAYAVAYRRDRGDWAITLRLGDLIEIIRRT